MSGRPDVLVVTGSGGMGTAVARRIGGGRAIVLADASPRTLDLAAGTLRAEGHQVITQIVDVSDAASVRELATLAAATGRLTAAVHTAGVSAVTSTAEQILKVDLLGTALFIDAFEEVVEEGSAVVCVASMAGHMVRLTSDQEQALANTPTGELLSLAVVREVPPDSSIGAYILAKRANQLRVEAAALAYNRAGARITSISPGVIATPMGRAEQEGATGEHMMATLKACGIGRRGTPGELAEAVAFLTGPGAAYLTGTDLLLDGGQAAWMRRHAEGAR
ncbi:SDR family oxidoreductase [Kineosporia succinea]|uniref:NAD(P)-dependent dehydrogenase (Short-subunit alcohol dehydrogenase family) n=1 Tax=Kineosporia succinea TaxID=84632 RepID=A0ABT9PC48_9ACTN|nr:SDR family oxidoreductase [Kineosporia succinea]MDP9830276.1 NAD(P)-dependent dehydrogenase (short-subunit alcohol dehydrogenase family) [Kineosporia succinea]